jgi:hypothetical protein
MTTNRRRPKNLKSGIYQQPLVGSYSNFKMKLLGSNEDDLQLKLRGPNKNKKMLEMKTTSKY